MNEKFNELPEDKKQNIINAGLEVFSKFEYKKASTEEIAVKSGISKSLLFYYFHNKKTFYMFLHDYAINVITKNVVDDNFSKITDFFDLCTYSSIKKMEVMSKNPHIYDFMLKSFFSQSQVVSKDLASKFEVMSTNIFEQYFSNIDLSKFNDDINPSEILQMLTLLAEGYMYDRQMKNLNIDIEEFNINYQKWVNMLKKISYKEKL